jgi:hypothetical protein
MCGAVLCRPVAPVFSTVVLDGAVGKSEHSPHDDDDAAGDRAIPGKDLRLPAHDQQVEQILVDADRRDDEADIRDGVSDKRSEAADLEAFLDTTETYSGLGERRAAALDRSHAKSDRESSAHDRARLSKHTDAQDDGPVTP